MSAVIAAECLEREVCVWEGGGLITTITNSYIFLSVQESCIHVLPRNTEYLFIDGQVCFYRSRQLFVNAVEPRGCISQPQGIF